MSKPCGDQSRNRGADQDFPTITDDELDAAMLTNQTHRTWLRSTTVEERAKLVRRVGELHTERREHSRTRGSDARVM